MTKLIDVSVLTLSFKCATVIPRLKSEAPKVEDLDKLLSHCKYEVLWLIFQRTAAFQLQQYLSICKQIPNLATARFISLKLLYLE